MPDGVPLAELLAALSGLVSHTGPWWMPSGADPVPLPPGLTVHVDVTVPMDHLAALLDESSSDPPGGNAADGSPPDSAGPPSDPLDAAGMPDSEPLDESPDIGSSGDPRACAPLGEASLGAGGRSMPVPAAVARALAAGGTWRRLITDPIVGTVVDVGRTRYRPPAGLADLVRARDRGCTHPGCEVPARGCDLDHITPWASGGTTSLENLTCLCRAHHRLKHTPGWALTRTGDGALIWRTPTGARYRREPDGAIALLPRRTGPRQAVASAVRVPDALARAVTPAVLDRLDKGLADPHIADSAAGSVAAPGCVAADVAATGGGESAPVITTRGPRPGENPGDYETTPYPRALHALGLTPLLDAIPPF
ncbi:HNH endonuclease signature motif containing protein [Actinomyces massiliensis]|uniref:HNH endonuclease signature motif containing protein n=1 Tax=Actinomyces massiliensis TaxID=461393 RepID=UPI0028ED6AD5|nr:HNH endonuclease signature motif containing protein [Actinomyces massiliensis]